ncbi:acyl-CoA N-acyltransferase [Massarina eburnea CBS 473.64]|uniref:Acyl-CoA N-acyltransferase n=1 Tax=Massarina eburnea CBS 473.64 TaxID=1395130 RepID=A0A6A6RT73_9PLEO|nr:acyl-CoA N-acyltransferase [Massarina eburnea CBS 473.64]
MEPIIETPRLRLLRLQDTSTNSQHLKWFHELWSDDACTAWSLHGKCHTLEESQQWMREHETKFASLTYAIFEKTSTQGSAHSLPGKLIGNIGLRAQSSGPTLPPFPAPFASSIKDVPLDLRSLGYQFFESAWGKGYATEAGKALVEAYRTAMKENMEGGKEVFYLEGCWDEDNPASRKVLSKLGFTEVGWKEEHEKVFLGGQWRDGGYWVWGLYL